MTVCVVGGGPAGMMAAIAAAENGNKVTLVEKNDKLGKKLFLTGKGRCNITNACPVEELFDNIASNPKFLYSAFYDFDNASVVGFFNRNGLATKTERGQRVFPVSDHSSDVIRTLKKKLESLKVTILLNTEAVGLCDDGAKITGVIIESTQVRRKIDADSVIMATGGKSYPLTGSDGKSFKLLEKYDIKIKSCEPSLVPFECRDEMITGMQGLSLKNVGLKVLNEKKVFYSGFGEMLFTHFGLSGPLVLSASAYVKERDYTKDLHAVIDLKPALTFEELDKRILRDFDENKNRDFSNCLGKLLPAKLITTVIAVSNIDPKKKVNSVSREERQHLCRLLKGFDVKIDKNRGFDEAIITRGGISVSEIDPSSMESRKMKGLYFAGEMIDVDALTGGFNLQIAWSTGHLAGNTERS